MPAKTIMGLSGAINSQPICYNKELEITQAPDLRSGQLNKEPRINNVYPVRHLRAV
jgi:hypothetical protein